MLNPLKKTAFLLGILLTLPVAPSAADELRIHVIRPRIPIDWSSPRTLSITSALDSAGHDYAPIGHFAVEIDCQSQGRSVLTGMERKDKTQSRRITLKEGLGLGSLTYAFEGQLQSAEESAADIGRARRDGRLKTMRVPTTAARCGQILAFLDRWVATGADRVYAGGKDPWRFEGSGCADFAMAFYEIASGQTPPREWYAEVRVPRDLIGGNGHKVPFTRLLARGHWAGVGEPSVPFRIADTDLVQAWLSNR